MSVVFSRKTLRQAQGERVLLNSVRAELVEAPFDKLRVTGFDVYSTCNGAAAPQHQRRRNHLAVGRFAVD